MFKHTAIFIIFFLFSKFCLYAQDNSEYGKIIGISENIVTVVFENRNLSVGDEISFSRFKEIVDPVTNRVRGGTETTVARGVVEDVGLGKGYVNIVWKADGIKNLEMKDRASFTGVEKKFVRVEKVTAKIQNLINDKEIEIDAGKEQEINEGDMFLIQRTEDVVDPDTKLITGQNTVDIGKGKVNNVEGNKSRAEVLELKPGITLNLDTDDVVFEPSVAPEIPNNGPSAAASSIEISELREEVDSLKIKVSILTNEIENLREENRSFYKRFDSIENDIEKVSGSMMSNDIGSLSVRLKNREISPVVISQDALGLYENALDDCLAYRFDKALPVFGEIIEKFPESPLIENCRYWIAQSHYTVGDIELSIPEFKSVIEDSRFTHKDDDASIMLGISYYKTGRYTEALTEFNDFVTKYPESEYRKIVETWIQKLS